MKSSMLAMQLDAIGEALRFAERPLPEPSGHDLLVEVLACGVCRTDLHVVDGDLHGSLPIIPGHEVVGRVIALGGSVENMSLGERVGIPWLGGACGIGSIYIEAHLRGLNRINDDNCSIENRFGRRQVFFQQQR